MEIDEINFSKHFEKRIEERNIDKRWVVDTITNPDEEAVISNEEVHFFKKIIEFAERCLKVVFNPVKKLVVTAHFDRKMTKKS